MGRVSGDPQPFEQPINIHYDDAGAVTKISYEGTSSFGVEAIAIGDEVLPYDIIQTFGKTRIEINYPYDFINSSPETEWLGLWEFFASKSEKDILSAYLPNSTGVTNTQTNTFTPMGTGPNGGIGPISANDAYLIRQAQQQSEQGFVIGPGWFYNPIDSQGNVLQEYVVIPGTGTDPVTNPVKTKQISVPAAQNPIGCYTLLLLLLRGLNSYPIFAPALRFTQTVTSKYAIRASMLNAGKIISSASLPTIENIPNGLLFNLPIDTSPGDIDQYIQIPGDLGFGWFKDFPTVRQVARLKWQILQEWQYGLWPITVFGYPL